MRNPRDVIMMPNFMARHCTVDVEYFLLPGTHFRFRSVVGALPSPTTVDSTLKDSFGSIISLKNEGRLDNRLNVHTLFLHVRAYY